MSSLGESPVREHGQVFAGGDEYRVLVGNVEKELFVVVVGFWAKTTS